MNFITATRILLLLVFATSIAEVSGQNSEIYLKIGTAKLLAAPSSKTKGYAYKINPPSSPYPSFYLELSKNEVLKNTNALIGISFIPTFSGVSINRENIDVIFSRTTGLTVYSFQLYLGIDRKIAFKTYRLNKNVFSLTGGLGFNLSGNWYSGLTFSDQGMTKSGEIFEGAKYTLEKARLFSPAFFACSRYHVINKIGNEVLALEFKINYAILKYYAHTLTYQVNGSNQKDYLFEKGFFIEFSLAKKLTKSRKK